MRIAIGSDHAGFRYKAMIAAHLGAKGHHVEDFGTSSEDPVDYPTFIRPVAEAVSRGSVERGIVLGGSGNGEAIVANRVPGVRCTLCWNVESARLGRAHNDANVLSLGQRMLTPDAALAIVDVWMATGFEGGRHEHRLKLIDAGRTGSSREQVARVVETYIDAVRHNDASALPLHSDVVAEFPTNTYRGGAAFRQGLDQFARILKRIDVLRLVVEEDHCVAILNIETVFGPIPFAEHIHVRDGQIASIRGYCDPRPMVNGMKAAE